MGGGGPRLEPPRLSRAHLEPGRPSGDPVQAERGPGGLSRLDLRQSPPRREPLGTAEGMACYCHPLRENRLQFHGRPLPRRHARLAQAITGPSTVEVRPMPIRRWSGVLITMLVANWVIVAAWAQDYPSRPVRLVNPYAEGGAGDVVGQLLAEKLTHALGQPVTLDNRPGASGVTAAQSVARAAPDGYTLLFGHTAEMAIAQSLVKDLGYDPQRDFKPVALGAVFPLGLVVTSSAAYSTIANMLAQSRSSRRPLLFASSGTGTPGHFAGELLRLRTNSRLTHVPYYGGGPALNAVLDGRVDFSPISQAEPR